MDVREGTVAVDDVIVAEGEKVRMLVRKVRVSRAR